MESKCHEFFSWAKIHKFSKIYILYVYAKAFILCLIKPWERTSKEKKRDGEVENHKVNEMGPLNMK